MFLLACSLDTGILPDSLFALNIMKIWSRSSEFNHHRETDRQTDRGEWQAHEFTVPLFGSKTVKHKRARAHHSGMFTHFEVLESARIALAPLNLRMLLARLLMACKIGLTFWNEVHFTLFVDKLLNDIWVEEPDNNFRSAILSSVLIPKLTWSLTF
jgi:hypothetical protein